LIENTSGARRGGDTRPSNCELVGVETAAPPPPMIAEAPNPSSPPSAATAMPPPSSVSATWLMRSGPWRTIKLPQPICANSAAAAERP
jgi:hypothetical protein